ncbi:uncharacterized protein EDB91DRAFT_1088615 [Suillus paluster]|uniref:uncharacterized protein n=1 Tax=Suillus paluster TaxID=48578 RepID=UPI001B8719A1|nr:uncharacterized protein EDB91DRAFT_1088615 [Suillus paluster]KAG1720974.1 hypothetical protein EDB91DRAFT_1088615 [Suillus paluster]
MKDDGQTSQQQATTVDSKALTASECAHENAGPTSRQRQNAPMKTRDQRVVRCVTSANKEGQARKQQATTVDSEALTASECAHENAGTNESSGTSQVRTEESRDGQARKQQATTVNSEALTASECAHENAGPTSRQSQVRTEDKQDGQARKQQATTVNSEALTASECAHENAGPTSRQVRHKCEQARKQQATTVDSEALTASECAHENAGPTSRQRTSRDGQARKQQATTVNSEALTASECAHENAGPTSRQNSDEYLNYASLDGLTPHRHSGILNNIQHMGHATPRPTTYPENTGPHANGNNNDDKLAIVEANKGRKNQFAASWDTHFLSGASLCCVSQARVKCFAFMGHTALAYMMVFHKRTNSALLVSCPPPLITVMTKCPNTSSSCGTCCIPPWDEDELWHPVWTEIVRVVRFGEGVIRRIGIPKPTNQLTAHSHTRAHHPCACAHLRTHSVGGKISLHLFTTTYAGCLSLALRNVKRERMREQEKERKKEM